MVTMLMQCVQPPYLFSKLWLTVRSFVVSSGLISFQGVGFSLVQTTTPGRVGARSIRGQKEGGLTRGATRKARQVPRTASDDNADDGVAARHERASTRTMKPDWHSHRDRLAGHKQIRQSQPQRTHSRRTRTSTANQFFKNVLRN